MHKGHDPMHTQVKVAEANAKQAAALQAASEEDGTKRKVYLHRTYDS